MKGKIRKIPPQDTSTDTLRKPTETDVKSAPEPRTEPAGDTAVAKDRTAVEDIENLRKKASECDALNERYLRLLAEYDNFRKRTARERDRLYQSASEDFMQELLPFLDNLDKATEHRKNGVSLEDYVQGIAIIEDQLRNVLSHAGLTAMQVVGQPFDPALHEAVVQIDTEEYEPGTIVQELQKGYALNGQVLRHPRVVVSK